VISCPVPVDAFGFSFGWGHGADELAGEEHLQDAGAEPDGDELAGEVSAGRDLLVADPDQAAGRHPAVDLGRAHRERLAWLDRPAGAARTSRVATTPMFPPPQRPLMS
jgi:hypothetical protein